MNQPALHKKSEVVYVTEYFPGSTGYRGGGAERLLERLATVLGTEYQNIYLPTIFIASDWKPVEGKEYPFETVVFVDVASMVARLSERASSGGILHIGNSFLALRFPELFEHLLRIWRGPIIQRVPNVSKVEKIQDTQGVNFLDFLSGIDVFISQSSTMTANLRALGLPLEKVVQIENGIDCERKRPLTERAKTLLRKSLLPEITASTTVFLYAGRMYDASKRIEDLLRVWLEGKFFEQDAVLFLAGEYHVEDGSLQPHLRSFFDRFSSEMRERHYIHFLGLLPESQMESYYQVADVYVSPSADEGFSNAMLEAGAFSLPIIGREGVHGNEHLIRPNETGFLFQDTDELSERMQELIVNKKLRVKLGAQARNNVEKHYTINRMLQKYVSLYNSLREKLDTKAILL